ncbi:MAG: type I-D CRISPR-associated protein Cas10d/Csc3, partial [Leptolyngbya sp. Prado105]|nr:type I-D CRISPR-associated protein Cas10d/Csc3 [Leptolyngbya sp. Prado105]
MQNLKSENDELNEDLFEGNFGFDETVDRTIQRDRELLTLKLLREAIQAQNPDDPVMKDFSEFVLPNLLQTAIGVTAKGGKFFDELDRQREAEGKAKIRRDNAADQSLNTHLLNGLFPANLIEKRLEKMDTTIKRLVHEKERRLILAAFILHDFEKFPNAPENCRKLDLDSHRQLIKALCQQLGLDRFIGEDYEDYLDDLLCMAYNAQRRWDTNWNFSEYGLNVQLRDRLLRQLCELTCLADSLASIVKHPHDAKHNRLKELIHALSDGQLELTYHSIAENRGVLTNVVNNALMEAHTSLNTAEKVYYEPLLYLPTGVIYLADRDAPSIDPSDLPDRVVNRIKELCAGQLKLRQTGFGRDGKGMKYAEYYNLFFDHPGLMRVALDATLRILNPTKASVAKSRSENLVKFQNLGVLPTSLQVQFEDDIRIDQLAEFGDLVSRKIWGEKFDRLETERKKNKKAEAISLRPEQIIHKVAEHWQLKDYSPQIEQIQRINESLKANKLTGNTGGVPYEWYFLAAKYLEQNPGLETVRPTCDALIKFLTELISAIVAQYQLADGWNDLRQWVQQIVMLPNSTQNQSADQFLKELEHYNAAKKSGRGRQLICSISHSAYTVSEQMESSVLFTPQVYTNKQHLNGSNAKRNISSIAGLEIMLRQILMNQTQAVGKRFEDGKYRYLYFYPTYYFTPETNQFLQKAYSGIAQTRFDTSLRNHFVTRDAQALLDRDRYQSADAFLIDESLGHRKQLPEDDPE